jgi:chemotaxis signal transduction protein
MPLYLLPIRVESTWLALDASQIEDIVGQQTVIAIPGAPPGLPGLTEWRGKAVAVVDLAVWTEGGTPLDAGVRRPRTLLARAKGSTVALPVDAVREVHEVATGAPKPARVTRQRFAESEIELDGMVLPILDIGACIASLAGDRGRLDSGSGGSR